MSTKSNNLFTIYNASQEVAPDTLKEVAPDPLKNEKGRKGLKVDINPEGKKTVLARLNLDASQKKIADDNISAKSQYLEGLVKAENPNYGFIKYEFSKYDTSKEDTLTRMIDHLGLNALNNPENGSKSVGIGKIETAPVLATSIQGAVNTAIQSVKKDETGRGFGYFTTGKGNNVIKSADPGVRVNNNSNT